MKPITSKKEKEAIKVDLSDDEEDDKWTDVATSTDSQAVDPSPPPSPTKKTDQPIGKRQRSTFPPPVSSGPWMIHPQHICTPQCTQLYPQPTTNFGGPIYAKICPYREWQR